jgi:hypothetical protein
VLLPFPHCLGVASGVCTPRYNIVLQASGFVAHGVDAAQAAAPLYIMLWLHHSPPSSVHVRRASQSPAEQHCVFYQEHLRHVQALFPWQQAVCVCFVPGALTYQEAARANACSDTPFLLQLASRANACSGTPFLLQLASRANACSGTPFLLQSTKQLRGEQVALVPLAQADSRSCAASTSWLGQKQCASLSFVAPSACGRCLATCRAT